jgi:hypothetical protein
MNEGPQNVVARGAGYETRPTRRTPDPLAWVPKRDWCGEFVGLLRSQDFTMEREAALLSTWGALAVPADDSGVSWHWSLVGSLPRG